MYSGLVQLLQELKPPYILLVQACIVVAFPYFLWRVCKFDKLFPLGVVQIFAGVLLGPGIFGALDAAVLFSPPDPAALGPYKACANPDTQRLFHALFGKACYHGTEVNRAAGIASIATIAVCLFGFLAGTDADKELVRKSGKSVLSIGVIGMIIGWGIGILAGIPLYYAFPVAHGAKANVVNFPIAFGLVIAVSALPVLAVILRGLDLTKRRLGAVALASASIADTMMWFGLGLVVALALGGSLAAALTKAFLGAALSIGFILYVASPVLNRMLAKDAPESAVITLAALSIFVASAITGITELHPVLGAFIAGYFLPDKVREMAAHRFDMTTVLVLMPFFFLNTGLNTNFSVFDPNVWMLFAISTVLCVVGKTVGHGLAARLSGENVPFSVGTGLLLQTKGLMGLIVCVVFLEKEVLSPLMFSAAVFMCMFSTGLPTPVMRVLIARYGDRITEGDKKAEPILEGLGPTVQQPHAAPATGSRPVLATLEFADGLGKFDVTASSVVIGRHTEDDINVNDIRVSRRHAKLAFAADGQCELINQTADRSQPNPISVNGTEREKAMLKDGDTVSLNGVEFTLRYARKAA
ncbi:MAG: cation:proton antiporter [Hyphomicrobiaceae bacterium]